MNIENLDELLQDIADIKLAIKRNKPLLREIAAPGSLVGMSVISLFAIGIFSITAHVLDARHGSIFEAPLPWRIFLAAYVVAMILGASIAKFTIFSKAAKRVDREATFGTIIQSFYGGSSFHTTVPSIVCMAIVSIFVSAIGHPWLCVPVISIFLGFLANALASTLKLPEYYALGYWGFVAGTSSLWFIEGAPFLWLFIVFGGMFASFAVTAVFLRYRRERGERT